MCVRRTLSSVSNGTQEISERRSAVRIDGPFRLQLRSRDTGGVLDSASIADNVSRWGLYTRLLRRFDLGRSLFGLVSLPTGSFLAARGRVVRLERLTGGGWGVGVHFSSARLLPAGTHEIRDSVRKPDAPDC